MAAGYRSVVDNCIFLHDKPKRCDSSRIYVIKHSLSLCVHLNNCVGGWLCVLFCYGDKTEPSEQLMGVSTGRNSWRVWDTQKTADDAQQHLIISMWRWRRRKLSTSGGFRGELWIKIECIVRSSCSWFEGRVNLPTEEFLLERQKEKCDMWIEWYMNDAIFLKETLAFQSIVLKNWCLLISSTPSGPAPTIRHRHQELTALHITPVRGTSRLRCQSLTFLQH